MKWAGGRAEEKTLMNRMIKKDLTQLKREIFLNRELHVVFEVCRLGLM